MHEGVSVPPREIRPEGRGRSEYLDIEKGNLNSIKNERMSTPWNIYNFSSRRFGCVVTFYWKQKGRDDLGGCGSELMIRQLQWRWFHSSLLFTHRVPRSQGQPNPDHCSPWCHMVSYPRHQTDIERHCLLRQVPQVEGGWREYILSVRALNWENA